MKKNQKRLLAIFSALAIIILSLIAGRSEKVVEDELAEKQAEQFIQLYLNNGKKSGKKILVNGDTNNVIQKISVNGTIDSPMTDEEKEYSILNQIKLAKEDSNVKVILLSVNTPGGGVYESAEIYKALLDSGKDVYVHMKKLATSGGYYISMASKKIFANEETTTGSLGVIMSSLSLQKYLEDKGIKNQIIRSGAQKAVGGLTEDLPESTLEIYKELNKESFNKFVDIISKGRNMERDKVLKLADGRIYSAKQALENGLIDSIGSEKDLIEEIKKEKSFTNPQVIEYKEIKNDGLLGNFVSSLAKSITSELTKSSRLNEVERSYLG